MHWADRAYDLKYVSLRYFNVAGAHQSGEIGELHQPETHLTPIVLQVAQGKREVMTIFGNDYPTPDGTCIRDYIHIDDLVNAHLLALLKLNDGMQSQIINLGSGSGFSNNEIVEAARSITKHPIPLIYSARREGDPATLVASNQKAKKLLGWEPKKDDIKVIIESAWKFHSNFPNGFEG